MVPFLLGTSLLIAGQAVGAIQAPPAPAPSGATAITCEAKSPKPQNGFSFDTKGVEFAPWIRRFVQRVRRNWFPPAEASTVKGCVILSFRVLRNGSLVEVTAVNPSERPAFTDTAIKALVGSSPVEPLPADYPEESALITGTFYFNQAPPSAPAPPPPAPDFSTQPEPSASPTRAVGHTATFKLVDAGTGDAVDLLRWFASGKAGATGQWLVEHQHSDGPGRSYCLASLALSGERLVFRSQNASEGFVATAQDITTVNRLKDTGTFTVSFR